MEDNIRYRTINVTIPVEIPGNPGGWESGILGKITVATAKLTDWHFRVGFSYCGPKDLKQFSRVHGQWIAYHRMVSNKSASMVTLPAGDKLFPFLKNLAVSYAIKKNIKWMCSVKAEQLR
jgi:hypothetical protein